MTYIHVVAIFPGFRYFHANLWIVILIFNSDQNDRQHMNERLSKEMKWREQVSIQDVGVSRRMTGAIRKRYERGRAREKVRARRRKEEDVWESRNILNEALLSNHLYNLSQPFRKFHSVNFWRFKDVKYGYFYLSNSVMHGLIVFSRLHHLSGHISKRIVFNIRMRQWCSEFYFFFKYLRVKITEKRMR